MDYILEVSPRALVGKKVKNLRNDGFLPAVVYGKGAETQSLSVVAKDFGKLFREAGTSTIVTLKVKDAKAIKVLVREPQIDPLTMRPLHVDFHQVNMKEKIRTEVPLEFIGASPVVVDQDGKLVTSLDALEIECLPDDLVQHIEVDLSVLKEFDDAIHVKDITIPAGIEVLTDLELVVVVVQAPLTEEELEAELAEETSEEEAVAAVEEASTEKPEGEEEDSTEGETKEEKSE